MASPAHRLLFTLLSILAVCTAQNLAGPQYVTCSCSPTKLGYRASVLQDLQEAVLELREDVAGWKSDRLPKPEIDFRTSEKAIQLWTNCVNSQSAEECVNADAALRVGTCKPGCASMCFYNKRTWQNTAAGKITPACDAVAIFKSIEPDLLDGPTPGGDVRRSAVNPNDPTVAPAVNKTPPPKRPNSNTVPPTVAGNNQNSPDPAQNANPVPTNPTKTPTSEVTPVPTVEAGSAIDPKPSRWEGCVAVEHLEGYVVQHAAPLRRAVLCAHGFCGTPNHGIIVDGQLTSMKRLCARKWECVRSVKWVNNLKLAANRRAVVNEFVTVTPYDVRFPKVAVWFVQILEDVFKLVAIAVAAGGVAAGSLLVSVKLSGWE